MPERIEIGDVQLNVECRGRGKPLLLVHGFPLDHTMWQAQIEALSAEMQVIAPDLRGFGSSDVTGPVVTMEQFADDLAALLAQLGVNEPVMFCGLSMGGYVGWEFWRRGRERVSAFVLCDTRAAPDTPEAAAVRLCTADDVLANGPDSIAGAMIERLLAPSTVERRGDVVEAIRTMIRSQAPQGIAAALRGMAKRRGGEDLLARIDVPTLAIVGRNDAITPVDEMRSMVEKLPRGKLVIVEDAGHMAPLENPEVSNAAIREFMVA